MSVNQSQRLTNRERVLLVLGFAGMLFVMVAAIVGGGWVGYAIVGKPTGAVLGGGIGWFVFLAVLDLILLKQSTIERGCIFVMLVVVIVAAYFATRDYEKKAEQKQLASTAAITAADR